MNPDLLICVLLMEDNPSDVFLVREALGGRRSGFDVVHVETVKEAQAALSGSKHFDVVIGDLNLPDSAHHQTLAFLTQLHLPVVVLNASDDPALEDECAARGMKCYSKQRLLDEDFVNLVRRQSLVGAH
jgi:CheY-like chemotaxis protein